MRFRYASHSAIAVLFTIHLIILHFITTFFPFMIFTPFRGAVRLCPERSKTGVRCWVMDVGTLAMPVVSVSSIIVKFFHIGDLE